MIYILLDARIVEVARPAHGQAGALADAIGMPLIAMDLSAYRLVPRNIVLACDGSPLCISVHSSRTDGTMTAVGGKSNLTDWKIQYT